MFAGPSNTGPWTAVGSGIGTDVAGQGTAAASFQEFALSTPTAAPYWRLELKARDGAGASLYLTELRLLTQFDD